jgi:hypothetical protein
MRAESHKPVQVALIAVVVVGLAIQAFVHFHLAGSFPLNKTSTLSEEDLFNAEAVAAVIAALALIFRPRRYTAGFAFLVAAAGTAAVVVYRYVNVGKIGPIPNMYDPYWAPFEKNLSVIAEAIAAVAAFALFVLLHQQSRSESTTRQATSSPSVSTV